jgi:hypothetical protein
MELDKRIKEGKRPLTCLDVEQARKFVGKECIFSDFFLNYVDIEKFNIDNDNEYTGILSINDNSSDYIFINDRNESRYRFILPCEWVKQPEKKYRPLSFKEFLRLFDFGDGVCFRRKGQDTAEFSMFLGYEIDTDGNRDEIPGEGKVNLGGNRYTLAELFEYYEMQLDDEWQPFGVLDE